MGEGEECSRPPRAPRDDDARPPRARGPVPGLPEPADGLPDLLSTLGRYLETHLPGDVVVVLREEMARREFQAYASGWRDAADQYEPVLEEARRIAQTRRLRLVGRTPGQAAVIPFPRDGARGPGGPDAEGAATRDRTRRPAPRRPPADRPTPARRVEPGGADRAPADRGRAGGDPAGRSADDRDPADRDPIGQDPADRDPIGQGPADRGRDGRTRRQGRTARTGGADRRDRADPRDPAAPEDRADPPPPAGRPDPAAPEGGDGHRGGNGDGAGAGSGGVPPGLVAKSRGSRVPTIPRLTTRRRDPADRPADRSADRPSEPPGDHPGDRG